MTLRLLLIVLIITLTPLAGGRVVLAAEPQVQVFFGPAAAEAPDSPYQALLRFIDSADQTLYCSVHELDMISVAQALADKAAQGVDVRLMLEADYWDTPKCLAARLVLQDSDVQVLLDTKKSGLMHNKFLIADGRRVFTGSTNLTETGLFYNRNNAIIIDSRQLAANYTAEFDEMQLGRFGKRDSGPPNTPHPLITWDDGHLETYFGPEDEPLEAVVRAIDRATAKVDMLAFVFSSEAVTRAIIRAHERGVACRVMLDDEFTTPAATSQWSYVPANALLAAGITVLDDRVASKLHHKVIIIDDRTVVTGSMNLSTSGALDNDENTLIITQPQVGQIFARRFEVIWTENGW